MIDLYKSSKVMCLHKIQRPYCAATKNDLVCSESFHLPLSSNRACDGKDFNVISLLVESPWRRKLTATECFIPEISHAFTIKNWGISLISPSTISTMGIRRIRAWRCAKTGGFHDQQWVFGYLTIHGDHLVSTYFLVGNRWNP